MKDTKVVELTKMERRNLKKRILNMKKEIVKKIVIKNEALESYKQKEIVNQEKRNKCFEENIKRKITSSKFEKLMYIYEQEGYELKLQRSLLEKEIYN